MPAGLQLEELEQHGREHRVHGSDQHLPASVGQRRAMSPSPAAQAAGGLGGVGDRQALADRHHPAGQPVGRHVHAGEQQQQRHRHVRDHPDVAEPQAQRAQRRARRTPQDSEPTASASARPGRARERDPQAEQQRAAGQGERGDQQPVPGVREGPPEEHGGAAARRQQHVAERAVAPLVGDRHRAAEDAGQRRGQHRVADDVEAVVGDLQLPAQVGEEQQLEQRADEQRADEHAGRGPVEQGAVGDHAADAEEPERPHASARVAAARARRST